MMATMNGNGENGRSLPDGWEWKSIEEVALVTSGQTPKGLEDIHRTEGIPFYKVSDMNRLGNETFMSQSAIYLSEEDVQRLKLRLCVEGTVIFPKRGGAIATNKKRILSRPSAFDLNIMGLVPKIMESKYLYYWFQSIDLGALSDGSNVPQINHKDIAPLRIPYAPREIQKQIVFRIEELLSDLDAGVAALERVRVGLKRYKASVLKAAADGDLVFETQNIVDLKKWEYKPLSEVVISLGQGWSPKCENEASVNFKEWALIKTTAIQPMAFLENENKRLPLKLKPKPNLEVAVGDLLITRAGPRVRVGITCVVKHTRPRLIICDKVYRLRCNMEIMEPSFLEIILNAPQMVNRLNKLKTGISDSGVNLTQQRFLGLEIPFPPLDEQRRIVAEVERRLSVVGEVESAVEVGLVRAGRLRQSVLRSAFEGRL